MDNNNNANNNQDELSMKKQFNFDIEEIKDDDEM